jgi:hypothetical protein
VLSSWWCEGVLDVMSRKGGVKLDGVEVGYW